MLKYRKCGFQMCFVVTSGMHQLLDTRNGIDIHNDSIQVFNYNGVIRDWDIRLHRYITRVRIAG